MQKKIEKSRTGVKAATSATTRAATKQVEAKHVKRDWTAETVRRAVSSGELVADSAVNSSHAQELPSYVKGLTPKERHGAIYAGIDALLEKVTEEIGNTDEEGSDLEAVFCSLRSLACLVAIYDAERALQVRHG